MTTVTLGKTGITVNKNGFGALPIQRITKEEAAKLLRKAYDGGITYFDTARAYSDSEEKIGNDGRRLLEGSRDQPSSFKDGLYRCIPVPQPGSLSEAGR